MTNLTAQETFMLSDDQLDQVSGGMKYTPGTKNDDVIDARGGQVKLFFGAFTATLDINGKISSIKPT